MPSLPLVPKRTTLGGFALLLFLVVLMGFLLFMSFAAGAIAAEDQIRLQGAVAAVLVVLGGLAAFLFFTSPREPEPPQGP